MKKYAKHLQKQVEKRKTAARLAAFSTNELAALICKSTDGFLWSPEWRALRKKVLDRYGYRCMCCGSEPKDLRKINVDHIKPRKYFPELALVEDNLQVLCGECNKRKGNRHQTDYRAAMPKQRLAIGKD